MPTPTPVPDVPLPPLPDAPVFPPATPLPPVALSSGGAGGAALLELHADAMAPREARRKSLHVARRIMVHLGRQGERVTDRNVSRAISQGQASSRESPSTALAPAGSAG